MGNQFGIIEAMLAGRWWIVGVLVLSFDGHLLEPWTHHYTSCFSLQDFLHFDALSEPHIQSTLVCLLSLKPTIGSFRAPCRRPFLGQKMQNKDCDSWICLKMKMASVLPRPGINPNYMSSTFTTLRMITSIIRSTTFNICFVSFRPRQLPLSIASALSLNTLKIKLSSHSLGIAFSRIWNLWGLQSFHCIYRKMLSAFVSPHRRDHKLYRFSSYR